MQLYYSTTSPYVRKVRIVAIEKGLAGNIELVDGNPWPEPTVVAVRNPLGKVPALVLDDGTALFDSPVICEYLDTLAGGTLLIPPAGPARWSVLRTQAVADGILDAGVTVVLERRRPIELQSAATVDREVAAIRRSVAYLAAELESQPLAPFDMGRIATAVAIGYLHFRLPDIDLGLSDPRIADWWSLMQQRPSLDATVPVSPP